MLQEAYKRLKIENQLNKWPIPRTTDDFPENLKNIKSYLLFDDDSNKNLIQILNSNLQQNQFNLNNDIEQSPEGYNKIPQQILNTLSKRTVIPRGLRTGKFQKKK